MLIAEVQYCSRCMRPHEERGACPYCGYTAQETDQNPSFLEERTLLNKRYMIGAVIGTGGFGITYAAWDRTLSIPVAIKEFFPQEVVSRNIALDDEISILPGEENQLLFRTGLDRFEREAHVLAMLQNVPGIVSVQNWFRANGTAYLVMEYLRGETLDDYCIRNKPDFHTLLRMLRQPIDALIICHNQGVLHRDISPKNLFVLEDGSVKLIDFGAAAQLSRRALGKDQSVLLNQHYAPMEQYDADGNQGPWSDVYALCATLYALLAGAPAPDAPVRALNSALPELHKLPVPAKQRRTIAKGMSIEPESRIQSMAELRSLLYNLPLPEEIIRRKRFVRRFVSVFVSVLVLAAIVLLNFTAGLPLGDGLLFSLRTDGLHIVNHLNQQEHRVLPSSKMGIPVSQIDSEAFMSDMALKRVTIPGSIASVGERAFYACPALEMVTLEEGVQAIADSAFAACSALHTFVVPDSLHSIPSNALSGASPILSIWGERDMPAYELLAETYPFAVRAEYQTAPNETGITLLKYTDGLADARPEEWDLIFPSYIDGLPVTQMMEAEMDMEYVDLIYVDSVMHVSVTNSVFSVPAEVVSITYPHFLHTVQALDMSAGVRSNRQIILGSETKVISDFAFSNLKSDGSLRFQLPEGLEVIGKFAFHGSSITEIQLPSTLLYIDNGAFAASLLQRIELPDSLLEIGKGTLYLCSNLQSIVFPASISEIPYDTAYGCANLTEVIIPDGIESISHYAFAETGLEYIHLPESVVEVREGAFDSEALRYLYLPEKTRVELFPVIPSPGLIIAGYPGSGAEYMAKSHPYFTFEDVSAWNVFANPQKPGSVLITAEHGEEVVCASFDVENNIPITLVETENSQGELQNLRSVKLPALTEKISDKAFALCRKLEEIELPATLKEIGSDAFSITFLKQLTLPENLTQIGLRAFAYCPNLTSISIPRSGHLKQLNSCFEITNLQSVQLPYGMLEIDSEFNGCAQLQNVTLPLLLQRLSDSFIRCSSLSEIVLPETLEYISRSFNHCTSLKDVYCYNPEMDFLPHGDGTEEYYSFVNCPNVIIHGYPGSTAEVFAQERDFPFEAITK